MRLLILSNSPAAATGYGVQTRLLCQSLRRMGHDAAVCAFYGLDGTIFNWNGIPVYPKARHPYGQDIIGGHALHFRADLVVTLMDAWVLNPADFGDHVRAAMWYPVDHEPLPPPVKRSVAKAWARITMSRFGEQMTKDAGLDSVYIPHCCDTQVYRPLDKCAVRQQLGLPPDQFIVLMMAANKGWPSRKAFPQQFEAFKQFHDRHPDAVLYVHSNVDQLGGETALDLRELVTALDLNDHVLFSDQYHYVVGHPERHLCRLYNAADVYLNVALGEGFGVGILEAQACGIPVIVGDWTSMSELCFAGWKVPKSEAEHWWSPIGAWQWLPQISAIADRLEQAYTELRQPGRQLKLSAQARLGALTYETDTVAKQYWKPALAQWAAALQAERKTASAPSPVAAGKGAIGG